MPKYQGSSTVKGYDKNFQRSKIALLAILFSVSQTRRYLGVRGIYPPVFTGDNCTGHCSRTHWQTYLLIFSKCTLWSHLMMSWPIIVPSFDASVASIDKSWHRQVVFALAGRVVCAQRLSGRSRLRTLMRTTTSILVVLVLPLPDGDRPWFEFPVTRTCDQSCSVGEEAHAFDLEW